MASIECVTFDNNTLDLKIKTSEESLSVVNLNLPGVMSNGNQGPWQNNTKIKGVSGTATKAIVMFNNNTHKTLELENTRTFLQGRNLTVTGGRDQLVLKIFIQDTEGKENVVFA
ncbi:hypothetical protein EV426DRAFT_573551 [Tirmania nivea]|nr:hypothetical protein EV426DRAFT_573551 [Tirmania nivea]